MMSFSKIGSASGAANYYSHQDNYYVLGSLDSQWIGKGAETLGLTGPVENEKLTDVLSGRLPDGSTLSRMVDGKETHRAGYDLTFSAPKSVSVMALIGGDTRLIEAHNAAVKVAMTQVESVTSARVMEDGKSEIVLTGNMVAALFNHDTSRDLDPQLHTHALVANATQKDGEWRALSSDKVNKNGFSETILANQVAFGKIYRHELKQAVEAMGYETQIVGKNGLWEMVGVPVEEFSQRSQAINDAAGDGASLKSRDMATLDTRKAKVASDPALLLMDWQERLKSTGFDLGQYKVEAQERTLTEPAPPALAIDAEKQVNEAVDQAIALLSDRKTQFTYSDVLAKTVGQLPAEAGVFDLARKGIDTAIENKSLIPLDKEKGIFTSNIHLVDELSIHAISKEIQQENRVQQFSNGKNVYPSIKSGAVYQLTTNAASVAVLSGIGGASVQRDRLAEVVNVTQEQGRQTFVLSPDKRSQQFLENDERLNKGVGMFTRSDLNENFQLPVNSTLVVDQAEKLTLKEMNFVLEQGRNQNAQVVFMDTEQRKGTGNALSVLQEAGVPRYQFTGRERAEVSVISEPDKRERYQQLASDYAELRQQGQAVSAQTNGARDQVALTESIRDALKDTGQLDRKEVSVQVLTPIFLDSKTRRQRDSYKTGQVMEYWNAEQKQRERYVIDRVTERTNTLTMVNEQGDSRVEKISQLDRQWSLFQPGQLSVASGDTVKALGRELNGNIKARDMLTVAAVDNDKITVMVNGKARELDTQSGVKLTHGYVESMGASVSDNATVLAAPAIKDMTAAGLNTLARSGQKISLYTAVSQDKAEAKLALNPQLQVVSSLVKDSAGKDNIGEAVTHLKNDLNSPVQQSVHLGLQEVQANGVVFSRTELLAASLGRTEGVALKDVSSEINAQIKTGDLISIPIAKGAGNDMLVARTTYDVERSVIRTIATGKDDVAPLMENIPESKLQGLTEGQQNATRLILETSDRFIAIQGYAGVGKTTQFNAVLGALETMPEDQRPSVIGLAPTHRAVHEMQEIGVKAQTLASFLSEESQRQQSGEKADYSNTLFLVDEASMIANRDMASAYQLIERTGGRAVVSGDVAQLQPIDPGQPFKLQQERSAIDIAVMKDIVRQSPELKPAIYKMIDGKEREALDIVNTVSPDLVPRREESWVPSESVVEIKAKDNSQVGPVVLSEQQGGKTEQPDNIITAIAQDYVGRNDTARENTLIVVHLNNDRRGINAEIHDLLHKDGLVGEKEASIPILQQVNVRSHELRSAESFEPHIGRVAMLENQYYTVAGVDKASHVVTLLSDDKTERLLSNFEASREEISLFEKSALTVSAGDKIRFSKSDNERGYVANSMWKVDSIENDKIVLTNGQQDKVIEPGNVMADQHIDLAYAVTAHGAQGASSQFVIALEGTESGRKNMVNQEGVYVAISRAKEHVQIYTDNKESWLAALAAQQERSTAHDILHLEDDKSAAVAAKLLETAKPLQETGLGRALLNTSQMGDGQSMAYFIAPGKKYPQPHVALPVYDSTGRARGVYLDELRHQESGSGAWLNQEPRIVGSEDARFAGLQASQNGDVRIASSVAQGFEIAAAHPESGVLIRLQGDGEPFNVARITGERIIDDASIRKSATEAEKPDTPNSQTEYPFIITEYEKDQTKQREELQKAAEQTAQEEKAHKVGELPDESLVKSQALKLPGEERISDEKLQSLNNVLTYEQHVERIGRDAAIKDIQLERIAQMEREIVKEKEIGE